MLERLVARLERVLGWDFVLSVRLSSIQRLMCTISSGQIWSSLFDPERVNPTMGRHCNVNLDCRKFGR